METGILDQTVKTVKNHDGKYLTFSLAGEEYGIGILKVKEIIGMMKITTVPHTPTFTKGVINLRGKVIPIVDLRVRFGMESAEYTDKTCIIVVEIARGEHEVMIGVIVDSVSEVVNIKGTDVEAAPNFGNSLDTNYIHGMAKAGDQVKILLDLDKVLSAEEMGALQKAA